MSPTTSTSQDDSSKGQPEQQRSVLLKIRTDGSFRQCDEGYEGGKWISGRWKLIVPERENPSLPAAAAATAATNGKNLPTKILFAVDRQYFGPSHDCFLRGAFDNIEVFVDVNEEPDTARSLGTTPLSVTGTVSTGRFVHPKTHASFFEEPILESPQATGNFNLIQMLSFATMAPDDNVDTDDAPHQRFQ